MASATRPRTTASRGMHPMFVELFMSADDDNPRAGGARRSARRAKRVRVRRTTTSGTGQRG